MNTRYAHFAASSMLLFALGCSAAEAQLAPAAPTAPPATKKYQSLSIGRPNKGALRRGARMPRGDNWVLMVPALAYGTEETVAYLTWAIDSTQEEMDELPGGHPLYVGHLSAPQGGRLEPHKSHQSGRDVDIGYFYEDEAKAKVWWPVNADILDEARTWAFLRTLLVSTPVEYVFITSRVQRILKPYALSIGEDPDWLDAVFQLGHAGGGIPVIVHEPGHETHMHIRFHNPVAEALGRQTWLASR